MHVQPSLTETTRSHNSRSAEGTRLHGRWLVLARVVWAAVVFFTLIIFLLSLPAYVVQLQTVCADVSCVYSYGQLTPGTAQALRNLGLSIDGYAVSTLALITASTLVSFGVAGLIFWRRSDDWMAMFVSLFLVTFGVNFSIQAQAILATNVHSAWHWSLNILIGLGWALLSLLLYLFPDGRFVPRWTPPLAVFAVASNIFLNVYPYSFSIFPPWVLGVIFAVEGVFGIAAQIYRYIRVSGPVQRQQTKWVVFGLAMTILVILGREVPLLIFPPLNTSSSFYFLFFTYIYPVGLLLIPLSLGVAILRFRLWDIDVLINRTLVYGTLTALLALLYFGLIFALQSLFQGIFHQNNAVAIVVSTLAIVGLFQPLRHRIQRFIDRRFYRSKYDAAKTLEAFNATLRNEVDLSQLSENLLAVVKETMQPASVSLWLRTPSQERRPDTNHLFQLNGVPGRDETLSDDAGRQMENDLRR
jgi:hypothetical protein